MRICLPILSVLCLACEMEPTPDGRGESVGYRSGTAADEYTSNGERGNVEISEIHWAGSVRNDCQGDECYDAGDVFIELKNRHPRPVFLKGWLITIQSGYHTDGLRSAHSRKDRSSITYVLPARENGRAVEPNETVIVAARRDGAFQDADFFIDDLRIPNGPMGIDLKDLDERLIDHVGDSRKPLFAGSWDGVTARSMERIQLIFNNRGNRDSAWHTYSLNDFDMGRRAEWHQRLRSRIHPDFSERTFATPGMPNSPDYSGNTSSGSFE